MSYRSFNPQNTDNSEEAGHEVTRKVQWKVKNNKRCDRCGLLNNKIFDVGTMIPFPLHEHCKCKLIPVPWGSKMNVDGILVGSDNDIGDRVLRRAKQLFNQATSKVLSFFGATEKPTSIEIDSKPTVPVETSIVRAESITTIQKSVDSTRNQIVRMEGKAGATHEMLGLTYGTKARRLVSNSANKGRKMTRPSELDENEHTDDFQDDTNVDMIRRGFELLIDRNRSKIERSLIMSFFDLFNSKENFKIQRDEIYILED